MTTEEALELVKGKLGRNVRQLHDCLLDTFNTAPGSTFNHQAWIGGYRTHLEQCFSLAFSILEMLKKQKADLSIPEEDIVLVIYFHDIEKLYRGERFDKYEYLKETIRDTWSIELSGEIVNAIRYIHGEGSDYSKKHRVMSPLCAICHMADIGSSRVLYFEH